VTGEEDAVLLVPVAGLLQVFHGDDDVELSVQDLLVDHGGNGDLLAVTLYSPNGTRGRVHWYHNQFGPMNPRAREALSLLTGAHVIFTGPVIFTDVDPTRVYEIVAHLSRKE
jgi:hypothetical protein